MTLGNIINTYRSEHDISMGDFARISGLSKSYVSMLERGTDQRGNPISPTITTINKVAQAIGKTFDDVFSMLDENTHVIVNESADAVDDIVQQISLVLEKAVNSKKRRIPILGRVAAGTPIEANTEIIDYEDIPERLAKYGEYFGLQITGDSMTPKISDHDIVIVRKQEDAEDGDIVIALINGNDAVCKKLKKYENNIALLSTNPAYPPMYFSAEEQEQLPVRIIGRVVELRSRF